MTQESHGEKSSMMDLGTYESLLMLARKYGIDSFTYGPITVNLGSDMSELPDPVNNPGGSMYDELDSGPDDFPLITNPTIGR